MDRAVATDSAAEEQRDAIRAAFRAQLTVRAVLTGVLLGGLLSICNIYTGLKVGWGTNVSITAALVAFAVWLLLRPLGTRPFGILENNVSQTAASAAAAVSSAGLVAPIPALTVMSGYEWSWGVLVLWTTSVMLVGIVVGAALRRQLVVEAGLKFPGGYAAAETLQQMYARGREAVSRVAVLGAGGVVAAAAALVIHYAKIPRWPLPWSFPAPAAVAAKGVPSISAGNLTFMLDPSPLMMAIGVLVGPRASVSLFVGAIIAWAGLAPWVLGLGWAPPGPPDPAKPWFSQVSGTWLLWPGVAMMVTASLASLAFSWRSIARSFGLGTAAPAGSQAGAATEANGVDEVPRRWLALGIVAVAAFASITQVAFFGIRWWTALLAVLLTFALAVVAGRVSGETNVTPVGAMGKVTQLVFGVLEPGSAAANLMSANVTGGAASQTGDLLHDLKTGAMLGASPRAQFIAQICGAVGGAFAGSAAYLALVPDARAMLGTEAWPAPAMLTWKAVAELFVRGLEAAAPGTMEAMVIAGVAGILLAAMEKYLPKPVARWVPSPAALGLGFVIPAYNATSMLIGALVALLIGRVAPRWSDRFLVPLAAGIIAGESLAGVGISLAEMARG
ncbi:MAG: OPT/YSL family transporter [Myxococcota bacterium]|nr:OPT/YSL family transporter [Myxococcota bacterium]